ncbi:unnamed protein product [Chrysodeixis includens]|uniref:Uncharacterized protein n=1 Tax=Chrysodeixis includens TaxID=689277 RepID=A0A9P0BRF5_CHRIL|nr:unnamed protein product [Chrysodeixis includens]
MNRELPLIPPMLVKHLSTYTLFKNIKESKIHFWRINSFAVPWLWGMEGVEPDYDLLSYFSLKFIYLIISTSTTNKIIYKKYRTETNGLKHTYPSRMRQTKQSFYRIQIIMRLRRALDQEHALALVNTSL